MDSQRKRQEKAEQQMNGERNVPVGRVVKADASQDETGHKKDQESAGFAIRPHLPPPRHMGETKITKQRRDQGIQSAMQGLAPPGPPGRFRQFLAQLVNVPKPQAGDKTEEQRKAEQPQKSASQLCRPVCHDYKERTN